MKALFLPQTCELGPSSRHRVYQLLPRLEQMGIQCTVSPGIDTPLYDAIYRRGTGSKLAALRAVWHRRRQDLATVRAYDVVFVQKGFFPGLYARLESRIARSRPFVFDLDDAIWLPREGGSKIARALHRESAVQRLLHQATTVTAGNDFLAEYARRFNRQVTVIPSVVDTARYPRGGNSTVVGWMGSRTTMPYLKPLGSVFAKLGIVPRVIASGDPTVLGFPADFRQWSLDSELDELSQFGIGIAPLPDTPWERGKCGVKLLQYMACGLPVVASAVGVHLQIIQAGSNGLLAETEADWIAHLSALVADPALRRRLGDAARKTVAQRYDISLAAERVAKVLAASTQTNGITGRLNRRSA